MVITRPPPPHPNAAYVRTGRFKTLKDLVGLIEEVHLESVEEVDEINEIKGRWGWRQPGQQHYGGSFYDHEGSFKWYYYAHTDSSKPLEGPWVYRGMDRIKKDAVIVRSGPSNGDYHAGFSKEDLARAIFQYRTVDPEALYTQREAMRYSQDPEVKLRNELAKMYGLEPPAYVGYYPGKGPTGPIPMPNVSSQQKKPATASKATSGKTTTSTRSTSSSTQSAAPSTAPSTTGGGVNKGGGRTGGGGSGEDGGAAINKGGGDEPALNGISSSSKSSRSKSSSSKTGDKPTRPAPPTVPLFPPCAHPHFSDFSPQDICPISLQPMIHAVRAKDGAAFNREAIEQYYREQKELGVPLTSPLTGRPMAEGYVKDEKIRKSVREVCEVLGIRL